MVPLGCTSVMSTKRSAITSEALLPAQPANRNARKARQRTVPTRETLGCERISCSASGVLRSRPCGKSRLHKGSMTAPLVSQLITLCLSLALGCLPVSLYAQGSRTAGSRPDAVPVSIVLVQGLGYGGAPAVVIRKPGAEPMDVILIRPDAATTAVLSEAILGLLSMRKAEGDAPVGRVRILRVRSLQAPTTIVPGTASALAKLREAPRHHISGVGSYPTIQFLLPRQQIGR